LKAAGDVPDFLTASEKSASAASTMPPPAKASAFLVENVYNLAMLCATAGTAAFVIRTFPLRLEGSTGLPYRILAEFPDVQRQG
jgi:hypothetical protein